MASSVGGPWEGQPFQYKSDIPLDLVARGLATMQGKTDQEKQTVQGYLDTLGSNQFYRDSDRQLVNERIKDTVNQLNAHAGNDLTDGRTQNDLMGVVNGLSTDPDVLDRIMANRNVGKQLQKIQYAKDHNSDEYGAINEQYFMKQLGAWQNDPSKIPFNSTYQPFVNTEKWQREAAESIAKNPDIYNEIHYTTVGGKQVVRNDAEIKEVTLQKIYQGMLGSLPSNVRGQFELEYNNAMWDPEQGKQIAGGAIDKNIHDMQALQVNLRTAMAKVKPGTPELLQAQQKMEFYNDRIQELANSKTSLMNGEIAPQDVMPSSAYTNDKLMGTAKAYAYRQETDTPNPWDMAFLKHKWDQDDIRLAASLKAKAAQPENALWTDDFLQTMARVNSPAGMATVTDDKTFKALMSIQSDKDKDGYFSKTFNNTPIFANMAPLIRTVIPTADSKVSNGYQVLMDGYKAWSQDPTKQSPFPGGVMGLPGGGGIGVEAPKDINSYIGWLRLQPGASGNFKQYGLDLNDPDVISNAKAVENKINSVTSVNIGNSTLANGKLKITLRPDQNNILRANDGSLRQGAVGVGSWDEISSVLGGSAVTDAWQKLGYLKEIDKGTNDHRQYQVEMWAPISGDVKAKYDSYAQEHYGPGFVKDNANELAGKINQTLSIGVMASRAAVDMDAKADFIKKAYPNLTEQINQWVNLANNNAAPSDKTSAAAIMIDQLFNKVNASNQQGSSSEPTGPTGTDFGATGPTGPVGPGL